MLDSLLATGGLVLLRDSVEWEGRGLLKALIKKSALRGEQVHVLGCEVSEEEFREGLGSDVNSRCSQEHQQRGEEGQTPGPHQAVFQSHRSVPNCDDEAWLHW